MNDDYIIKKLLKLSKKAYKKNEIPIAAIVTLNNKIISYGINNRQKSKNVLGHAEIIAIQKAAKKLHDWRLNNCDIYVTLKPCELCNLVINNSRINNIYYILDSNNSIIPKNSKYNNLQIANKNEFEFLLKNSFKKMR